MAAKTGKSGTAKTKIKDLKAEIRKLKRKAAKLRKKLKAGAAPAAPDVSPLAPAGGFPPLPSIAGVALSATAAGVRYADRTDVMLARLAPGTSMAGVFTKSATRSAAVLDCEAKIAGLAGKGAGKGGFAILVNSGNSNAFTGAAGAAAVQAVTSGAAKALDVPVRHVFTASTGVIGEPLPVEKVTGAIADLKAGLGAGGLEDAARAIMTTDTYPKGASAELEIGGAPIRIAGIAKGSGMIAPDMATMLVFIFTDAKIEQPVLQSMLSNLTGPTFNAITVDGDTSTSDTLLLAATGKADMAPITSARSAAGRAFAAALRGVMEDLAKQVVRDGEGATKFIEVAVTGATSPTAARKVALAIANSPLVKTAAAGEDPNWGRIVMAVGKSGAPVDRDALTIRLGDILVAEKGWVAESYREADGAAYMQRDEIRIGVDLGLGKAGYTAWTCDLTHQYIAINADYRS
ncbi:bifunctional glutamate N-acetyltransferase/amino-acid acetyltransferase ArgJ [Rhodovulum sp. YNF3179]|uniref:bifunctional glutamate N-acetyltransferase/amino-acid acetyltransferase ArgJ n=1 Tax=Rhodovulum sp. YNF3179 TaxID=3425127 RepID=UPI003D32ADF8